MIIHLELTMRTNILVHYWISKAHDLSFILVKEKIFIVVKVIFLKNCGERNCFLISFSFHFFFYDFFFFLFFVFFFQIEVWCGS